MVVFISFVQLKSKETMARQKNDGKGRMGGRQKGTPNKVTGTVKEWLSALIDRNREQIEEDLRQLEPRERLAVLEKFMQYIVPKPKTELAVTSDRQQEPIIDLSMVPDDVICEMADKLLDYRDKAIRGERND